MTRLKVITGALAVGVYRPWRDAGFAIGALIAGAVAGLVGLVAAIWVVAVLTALSGGLVAPRMYETLGRANRESPHPDGVPPSVPRSAHPVRPGVQ